jgi:hypothetical protein
LPSGALGSSPSNGKSGPERVARQEWAGKSGTERVARQEWNGLGEPVSGQPEPAGARRGTLGMERPPEPGGAQWGHT